MQYMCACMGSLSHSQVIDDAITDETHPQLLCMEKMPENKGMHFSCNSLLPRRLESPPSELA